MDNDEEAFKQTEKAILSSYQVFIKKKHGEPSHDKEDLSTFKNKGAAMRGMKEMVESNF